MRVAIVMSRLPRLISPDEMWLSGLRAALRRIHNGGDTLMIHRRTAGSALIRRGAERLGLCVEEIAGSSESPKPTTNELPAVDRSLLDAADLVIVLGMRAEGNLHRLLRERIQQRAASGAVGIELVDLPGLQPPSVTNELLAQGVSCWRPDESILCPLRRRLNVQTVPADSHCQHAVSTTRPSSVVEVVPFPSSDDWDFLSHTTRACPGPWPGESEETHFDNLLDAAPEADHSAVATLARIVTQRRLIASDQANRGRHRVVCLTAVPLIELPELHRFRAHRGRWDFEPFGLAIRRDWLISRGVRPVIYGDDTTWSQLDEADRPFFQLVRSKPSHESGNPGDASRAAIDWTLEHEWRCAGDLDLSDLPPSDGLVFVPDYASLRRLAEYSPWPITLWPDPKYFVSGHE